MGNTRKIISLLANRDVDFSDPKVPVFSSYFQLIFWLVSNPFFRPITWSNGRCIAHNRAIQLESLDRTREQENLCVKIYQFIQVPVQERNVRTPRSSASNRSQERFP